MIQVGDRQLTWQPGMTLDQVMKAIEGSRIYSVVRLNGKLVSKPDFPKTPVPDEAEIQPLPLVAGG